MIPARMCLESLDRRPGIREQPGSKASILACPTHVRLAGAGHGSPFDSRARDANNRNNKAVAGGCTPRGHGPRSDPGPSFCAGTNPRPHV